MGVVEFWRHVYPTLKDTLDKPLMRLLLLGVSWLAGLLAYIQARLWIMLLTEVDPNNFPRALIAFAGLLFVPYWLITAMGGGMIVMIVYMGAIAGIVYIREKIQFVRGLFGKATQTKSPPSGSTPACSRPWRSWSRPGPPKLVSPDPERG